MSTLIEEFPIVQGSLTERDYAAGILLGRMLLLEEDAIREVIPADAWPFECWADAAKCLRLAFYHQDLGPWMEEEFPDSVTMLLKQKNIYQPYSKADDVINLTRFSWLLSLTGSEMTTAECVRVLGTTYRGAYAPSWDRLIDEIPEPVAGIQGGL